MSVLSTASKFLAFPRAERRLLLTCAVLLVVVAATLRIAGFKRVQRWLARPHVRPATPVDATPETLAVLVNAAANHLPIACSCLTRSLVLGSMLHRRGVESDLRIGVRVTQGRLEAHAWVELAGQPLNDSQAVADQFAPFNSRVWS